MMQAAEMDQAAAPLLAADLFSIDGKLSLALHHLSEAGVVATTDTPPPAGSIAILVRNRVRLFATVAWIDGHRLGLKFDDPLRGWRMEDFVGPRPARAAWGGFRAPAFVSTLAG